MTEGRTNEVPGYGYGEPDTAHSPRPSTNDQWGREDGRNHLLGHPISDQHLIQGCRALGVAKGFPLHAHRGTRFGAPWSVFWAVS
jgi:hypothetical protein